MSVLFPEHPLTDGCMVLDLPEEAIPLDMTELTRALGYPGTAPPEDMAALIASTAGEIKALCSFRAGYTLLPTGPDASRPDGLLLGNRFCRTGKIVRKQLEGAEEAALLICTIGPEPEQRVKTLLDHGEPALGFIADVAASVLVEKAMDAVHRHLEHKLEDKGLGVSNRFSPGYCGWDVHEQHELFRWLPQGFCGVQLEDSAFMQPRKSVSAIVGIGQTLKRVEYPCVRCDEEACLYRQKVQ